MSLVTNIGSMPMHISVHFKNCEVCRTKYKVIKQNGKIAAFSSLARMAQISCETEAWAKDKSALTAKDMKKLIEIGQEESTMMQRVQETSITVPHYEMCLEIIECAKKN
jgi:hypothetical protein